MAGADESLIAQWIQRDGGGPRLGACRRSASRACACHGAHERARCARRAHPGSGSETPRWPRAVLRHARRGTDLSTALVTGAVTLGAVTLTFGANSLSDHLRSRRAVRSAQDAAIAELLAAAIDLVQAVNVIQSIWKRRTGRRARLLTAASLARDIADLGSWKDLAKPGGSCGICWALSGNSPTTRTKPRGRSPSTVRPPSHLGRV